MDDARNSDRPFNRLTRLCDVMTTALDEAIEAEEPNDEQRGKVRTIVFLEDDGGAGIETFGYESSIDAMVSLFVHMKAVFQAEGKDLEFIGIPENLEGIDHA